MAGYLCHTCDKYHDELCFAYGADAPASWLTIPAAEREKRGDLTAEVCMIDEKFFFIRGNIDIPVAGHNAPLSWGVWISVSKASMVRCGQLWETPRREKEPLDFGWLNTVLPGYPNTLNLKTRVHTRPVGERPFIELEPTDHPFALEQRNGIMLERVQQIAEQLLHGLAR